MRKIIQIAIEPESERLFPSLHALCDDGTLWYLPIHADQRGNWHPQKPIPQNPAQMEMNFEKADNEAGPL